MVHPARFELATPGSEDQCSNPLSYGCVLLVIIPDIRINRSDICIFTVMSSIILRVGYNLKQYGYSYQHSS